MLNPTSKLLAVVGYSQVTVVVLPRKGWNNSSLSRTINVKSVALPPHARSYESTLRYMTIFGAITDVLRNPRPDRSISVGQFYHSLPGSSPVAQVTFHEWGENGSSLLILTQDGILRDYSLEDDVEEPATTLNLCDDTNGANGNTGRSGGFSADDIDGKTAVGFCFGDGAGDWGKLTLYGLMRNGDILAVCPYLPKKSCVAVRLSVSRLIFEFCSSVPTAYIHALSHFVSSKVDYLSASSPLDDSTNLPSSSLDKYTTIYSLQLRYVKNLMRQATTHRESLSTVLREPTTEEDDIEEFVKIVSPASTSHHFGGARLKRQGPFLLQPAPQELDGEIEEKANDIAYIHYSPTSTPGSMERSDSATLGVFMVSYNDGKIDICVEVEKVEARWAEGKSLRVEESLPTLVVYETIDLGLLSTLRTSLPTAAPSTIAEIIENNWTTIAKDSLYSDTLYIHHSLGAHCLLLSNWLDELASSVASPEEDAGILQNEVERSLKTLKETEVLWILKTITTGELPTTTSTPVDALALLNDVYLGYSILLVTASLQLVPIELSFRVDPSLLPSFTSTPFPDSTEPTPSTPRGLDASPPAYVSLLDSPFVIPAPLDRRTGVPALPRVAIKPPTNLATKAEITVTPASLRFLGTTVESFRTEIRSLVSGADVVQHRLELQMKELSRQLGKLKELSNLANPRLDVSVSSIESNSEHLTTRIVRVKQAQESLLRRSDKILQRLMESHQPLISTFEKKWFEELARLEGEILGAQGGGGGGSILRRVERVEGQIEMLRPDLEGLRAREEGVDGKGREERERNKQLGSAQMRKFESLLSDE